MTERLYTCSCGQAPRCGCRLTDPPSYWGVDGERHFYDEPEPRVADVQALPICPLCTKPITETEPHEPHDKDCTNDDLSTYCGCEREPVHAACCWECS